MIVAEIPRNNVQEIFFNWDGIEYNCPSLHYNFTSNNCGNCVLTAPTEVNCSRFTTSTAGVSCNFSVGSNICDNIFGEVEVIAINLKGTIINFMVYSYNNKNDIMMYLPAL